MTVAEEIPYNRYEATPGTTVYSFTFSVLVVTDLRVTYLDTSGVSTVLVKDTDYAVSLNPNKTGSITLVAAYSDGIIELRRNMPLTQNVHWVNHGPFDMDVFELSQDKITMILQQFNTSLEQGQQVSSWRGDWANNTLYYVGDNATDPSTQNIYVCKVEHTSNTPGTIQSDIALGYWALALDTSGIMEARDATEAAAAAAAASQDSAENSANSATNSEAVAVASATSAEADADRAEQYASAAVFNANVDPIGLITHWFGGYFTATDNANFQDVLGNTIAAANAYLADFGYVVCDGSEFYDADSPIFNQPGRFLPNLIDERVIMGKDQAGEAGGANTVQGSHVHATGDHTLTVDEMPAHTHSASSASATHTHTMVGGTGAVYGAYFRRSDYDASYAGPNTGGAHSHTITVDSAGGGAAHNHGFTDVAGSTNDNRPQYLAMFPIMKYKYAPHEENLNYFIVQPE